MDTAILNMALEGTWALTSFGQREKEHVGVYLRHSDGPDLEVALIGPAHIPLARPLPHDHA